MRLGKASAYGVFATIYIAEHEKEGPIQGRDVAESCGIPVEYLLKILQQLVKAQVLRSVRGRGGGFLLRRSASKITLLDIVQAIEGPIEGELTVRGEVHTSKISLAKVENVWGKLADKAKSVLRTTTIKQLMM
jgi:Rrf2 family transcriptional regulator, iron-sulfur cluster assembly transcription factor